MIQSVMEEKEIQTEDENIPSHLLNLINLMFANSRWLNKRQVQRLRNLLKNCCYAPLSTKLSSIFTETTKQSLPPLSSRLLSPSNDLLIIGAGQMRTGTTSLKCALQMLCNQSCYHMYDVIYQYKEAHIQKWINIFDMDEKGVNIPKIYWNDIYDGCKFAVDYPTCVFYKELMNIYPNAKVILTLRDADSWIKSCRATTASDMVMTKYITFTEKLIYHLRYLPSLPILHDKMYTKMFGKHYNHMTDNQLKFAYQQWNQQIIDYVPKNRLLIYHLNDGWQPLCEFLNKPIPLNIDYPHLNKRDDMQRNLLKYRYLAQFLNFLLIFIFVIILLYLIL